MSDRQQQWEHDFQQAEARGECIHSGLLIVDCKRTVCDCFDYEPEYGVSQR